MWVTNILFTELTLRFFPVFFWGWRKNCRRVPSPQSITVRQRDSSIHCDYCTGWYEILHKEPFPTTSSTRDEQLRDSVGPPPEEVPRKVAAIHCDMVDTVGELLRNTHDSTHYVLTSDSEATWRSRRGKNPSLQFLPTYLHPEFDLFKS
jgi:hypothetical protein